jgi:uncharacterized OB-fold protein
MSAYVKPLPQPDPVTTPYWDSLREHAMKIQRCNDTGKYFFYPRGVSPFTLSDNISWELVSGQGTLHAFTIVYNMRAPGFADEVPYVVAIVELAEGPRLMTNLIGVEPDPAAIKIGTPVEIVYDDVTDEITLPKFRPRPS